MKRFSFVLFLSVSVFSLGACDKDGAADGAPSAGKAAEGSKATYDLAPLPLQLDGISGAKASTLGDSVMVQGPGFVVSVDKASEFQPATLDDAKKEADEMYGAKNISEEKTDSGWLITFTNKGAAGSNYWVQSRQEIDGQAYACSTTAQDAAMQANAAAACKSLRKK
jgi:hypothetical protein